MPITNKWEQQSIHLLERLVNKYHCLSDMEYDELQVLSNVIKRNSRGFKSKECASDATYLLARFYFLEKDSQYIDYTKARYKEGDLRCGLLLLDHELRTQQTPPLFSRMEQLHIIRGLEKNKDPFIVSLLKEVSNKIQAPTEEEKVLIHSEQQYQWFAKTFLTEDVPCYFEPFLHPEKFSALLETLINSDLDAFLALVKPEMTSSEVEREWGTFKFYLETNMGNSKSLLMLFMPVMNNIFSKMLTSNDEKAHCLMQTLQKIPESILPNLSDRITIFQSFIPEKSSLLAFHHIMYRPEHESLNEVGTHKPNAQDLMDFLSSKSCHTMNFVLQAGFYLADSKRRPPLNLNRIQNKFFEGDYGFAIINIYEHLSALMGRDETILMNQILKKLGPNTSPDEVLLTATYVLERKKLGAQDSVSNLIDNRPPLETLEKSADLEKNVQRLMYIRAKQFEMKDFKSSPQEQAKQDDLCRFYQTVAAEQYIDKYLDIERIDRVTQRILGREVHNRQEAFKAIDAIYNLKNFNMLALYNAFMLVSPEYKKKDITIRTSEEGVPFTKLRDEVSNLLKDPSSSSLSTQSVNPGILRANQPTYLDWRFQSALRNRVVDINAANSDEDGFSKQLGSGPVTASISGHAYFLMSVLINTYKVKTELDEETFADLEHFVRVAVTFYVMQGYHNFAEMMVPMQKDPVVERALRGKPLKDVDEQQDSEEELDMERDFNYTDDLQNESELEESEDESVQTLAELFSSSDLDPPKDVLYSAMHETVKFDSLSRGRAQINEEIIQSCNSSL